MAGIRNYETGLYNQFEELLKKSEEQTKLLKENNKTIKELNTTIKSMQAIIDNLNKTIEQKDQEILRLKSKNDKDSSNSSKPSSTNDFKKVITNRREKSNNKKGGQKFHKPHSLNNKLEQFINSGNIKEEIIEINKNEGNKNKRYIEKVVIDIEVTKVIKRYRYYPNEHGKYNIPQVHNQKVQYGSTVKAIAIDLMNNLYNSTDGVTRFINDITNGGITLSKGTLINWNQDISLKFSPVIENIEAKLMDSYYLNHDESQIKIDGDGYNILCACNNKYTRLWTSEHKSQEAIDKIGFLPKYQGVIVKDGTELYNKYGCFLAQCLSHIQRYLKGIYDFISHKAPKKLAEFLSKCNTTRNELIAKEVESFTDEEYRLLIGEYESIIDEWEVELRQDVNNYLFDDESNLWTRMKYDNKKMDKTIRGDRDEILYFLKDFKVPSTNNQAETSQRGVKIKQKIGKFRSVYGAENYSIIKSCILTYKKNNINVFDALINAFNNNPIMV
ncbi:MAG: transposase [Bacilli bacterium]|nr:transposase [Bacilli bacterium]